MRALRALAAIAVMLLAIAASPSLLGAPFETTIQYTQPNGTIIDLWGKGDDFQAVFETLDGYTVLYDPTTKSYRYAQVSADKSSYVSTGIVVGEGSPATYGLTKHLRIDSKIAAQQARARRSKWTQGTGLADRWSALKATARKAANAAGTKSAPPDFPTTGDKVGLCLLIDFDDDPATIPQANIVSMLNADNYTGYGNNGSVKKYFQDVSNGLLNYTNVVTVYIRIPNSLHPKKWYNNTSLPAGQQANYLIRDAITIMKALPNYTKEILPTFDSLTTDDYGYVTCLNVFYAGGNGGAWSYGLWPHSGTLINVGPQALSVGGKYVDQYQISNIGSKLEIGTFCHENGHMLCGFPDLYDYDYDSIGGAGKFSLMGYGDFSTNPAQVDAYLKLAAGWATVTDMSATSYTGATLTASAGSNFNHFYRFKNPSTSTEYFLLENRQQTGRDANIPGSGIAIWHVDELGNGDNQSLVANSMHANYELTLVQADNKWHLETTVPKSNGANFGDAQDLYYLGNTATSYTNLFTDTSLPSAHWWSGKSSGANLHDFSACGDTMTFQSGVPAKSDMLTPTNGSTLTSASIDFNWTAGEGVSEYALWIGNTPDAYDLYAGFEGTNLSKTIRLPADGRTIYVRLWSKINGAWVQYNSYSYTTFTGPTPVISTMVSPVNSGTFTSPTVTFNWTEGVGIGEYALWIGSTPDSYDIYAGNEGTNLSKTVTLPADGRTIYVRLWSLIYEPWQQYNSYTYTAYTAPTPVKAKITYPLNGSTFPSSSVTFGWDKGISVTQYALWVGSTPNSYDLYAGVEGTNRTKLLNLPVDGRTIYVRVWSLINGAWQYNSYVYTANSGANFKANMTSPASGSTLTSGSATFTWTAGTGVTQYALWVGSTANSYDLYAENEGTNLSKKVTLPTDGRPLYVRLWSMIGGAWQYNSYIYTANLSAISSVKAQLTSPANGTTLTSGTATFKWTAGTGATQYALWVGSTPDAFDLYAGIEGTNLTKTLTLPTDGRTLYVRLWSMIGGVWTQYNSYVYTAMDGKAQMLTPASGSTFSADTVTFTWNAGTGATQYALWIGSAPGDYDLYAGNEGANLTKTVTIPTDGRPVYVQLWSLINGTWTFNRYIYSAHY